MTNCILCQRPLPEVGRWDFIGRWILPPPPMCRGDQDECFRLLKEREGLP